MSDQVAVLESIRDVLSGKASAPASDETQISEESSADAEEIMDLTMLVNDDGSITDLELEAQAEISSNTEEIIEPVATTSTAGDDVLDEIDKLLSQSDNQETEQKIEEEHLESITDDSIELELADETKIATESTEPEAETNFEDSSEVAMENNSNEDFMTENTQSTASAESLESLISDEAADKAKSAISDLLKVTGKDKSAPAPSHPSPSFRNGDTVEDLVLEGLRPMLKKWLDENLNSLVEEIVQKEISRIIPK